MDRCPNMITIRAGDESHDYCDLTARPSGRIKPCLLMSGEKCEEWENIKKEEEDNDEKIQTRKNY